MRVSGSAVRRAGRLVAVGGWALVARGLWALAKSARRLRRLRRGYFPAAVEALEDLAAPGALGLLGEAPGPARAGPRG